VEWFVVIGDGDASALPQEKVLRYDELLEAEEPGYAWPQLDEQSPASMCHTSGTTGNPKGVVYSHRSQWCHTFGGAAAGLQLDDRSRVLVVVPQFHANGWGLIYLAWLKGADILQPERYLQPEPLTAFITSERPTCSAAVPSVWNGVLEHARETNADLSCMSWVVVGGSAVPPALIDAFEELWDIEIIQAWGMTETNPIGAIAYPPREATPEDERSWRGRTGRIAPGIDMRIIGDDGLEQPWDGTSLGEFQARGPWVTASYHDVDAPEKFSEDGWLRTGDIGTIDELGFMQIVDRTKDVIKSGGEWISSVDLENALMGHPDVAEAAVIGVPDEKWAERPMACVVPVEGTAPTVEQLSAYLAEHVASWQVPERWAFVDEVPKTSVGKFDKKVLRRRHEEQDLRVTRRD
jgi:fatty-acyl-CoA synthase